MGYIFLKLTVSEPVCDHSGLCCPLHEYSTTVYGLPYWPISHYSEGTTSIIVLSTDTCEYVSILSALTANRCSWESHIWSLSFLHDLHPPTGWRGLFLLDGSVCVLSLVCLEISQASILTLKALGWLNQYILISPRMQYQGIPESWWNANEIDPVHLLVAVNSQDLEPVQPATSCWFAGVAKLQV